MNCCNIYPKNDDELWCRCCVLHIFSLHGLIFLNFILDGNMMSYISPVKSSSNMVSLGATKWDKMSSMRSQCANDNAGLSTWKGRRNWWKDGAVASQKLEELNGFQQKWGGRCRLCFARNFVGLSLKGMSFHRFFNARSFIEFLGFSQGLPIGFCYSYHHVPTFLDGAIPWIPHFFGSRLGSTLGIYLWGFP